MQRIILPLLFIAASAGVLAQPSNEHTRLRPEERQQLRRDIREHHLHVMREHQAALQRIISERRALEDRQMTLLNKALELESSEGAKSPEARAALQREEDELRGQFEALRARSKQLKETEANQQSDFWLLSRM